MAENIIYYGPPGTGKTYLLQNKMSDYIDYQVSDAQIIKAYQSETKEWILISLIMIQSHGKMKPSEIQTKIDSLKLGKRVSVASVLEAHSMNVALADIIRKTPSIFFECGDGYWYVNKIKIQQNMPDFFEKFLSSSEVERRYAFVTFHQSFSYEDFIEGIRPAYVKETNSIDYSPKDGVFKEICRTAAEHPEKEYAVFIDEINRGNISEIFGELISLIEVDKRKDKHRIKPHIREPTPEQRYQQEENRCYKVLSDYFHHLRTWKQQYAPKQPEDEWHPLFVEALQRESHIEYLLDVLLYGTAEEKKALVAEQRKEVMNLGQRFAEHPDGHDRGGSQRKSGLDR